MLKMLSAATAVFLCWIFSASAETAAGAPHVVVSIKPVHSLVAGVMDGVGNPTLLIQGGGSPHTYSLRPSEALALQEADVVFWIGEELEGFLARPLQTLPRGAGLVALHEADGVRLLAGREGGGWEDHAHEHEPGHVDAHEHQHARDHQGVDMHVWLDPLNAQAMVAAIAKTLSTVDPQNEEKYASNAIILHQRLAELNMRLRDQLAPVQNTPYIVFHDAYQYFEERYGLNAIGSLTVTPEHQPGVQRLYEIRAKVVETRAKCVFSEPQFASVLVETVVDGTPVRLGVLDPLGTELAAGPDAYFDLMDQLAGSLRNCLDEAG